MGCAFNTDNQLKDEVATLFYYFLKTFSINSL